MLILKKRRTVNFSFWPSDTADDKLEQEKTKEKKRTDKSYKNEGQFPARKYLEFKFSAPWVSFWLLLLFPLGAKNFKIVQVSANFYNGLLSLGIHVQLLSGLLWSFQLILSQMSFSWDESWPRVIWCPLAVNNNFPLKNAWKVYFRVSTKWWPLTDPL